MEKNEIHLDVASQFRILLKTMSSQWKQSESCTLSIPQFQVLEVLRKRGSLKVSELAAELALTPAAITGITDRMLTEGYVERERASDDRRVVYITITEAGNKAADQAKESRAELIRTFFEMLPEEDIQHLQRIFTLMLTKTN